MSDFNLKTALELYQSAGYETIEELTGDQVISPGSVVIQKPGHLATGNPKANVPDAFGGSKDQYFASLEALQK